MFDGSSITIVKHRTFFEEEDQKKEIAELYGLQTRIGGDWAENVDGVREVVKCRSSLVQLHKI